MLCIYMKIDAIDVQLYTRVALVFHGFNRNFIITCIINMYSILTFTGLAGIPSDTPAIILHASPQNSPGEVKSPSAGKKTLLFLVHVNYYN